MNDMYAKIYPRAVKLDEESKMILISKYAKFVDDLEQLIYNVKTNAKNDLDAILKLEPKSPERHGKYIELFNKYIENEKALNEISTNTKQAIKFLSHKNGIYTYDITLDLVFAIAYLLYKTNTFTPETEIYDVIDYMFKPDKATMIPFVYLVDFEKNKLITSEELNHNIINIVLKEIEKLANLVEGSTEDMINEDFDKYLDEIIESTYILITIASQYILSKEKDLINNPESYK